MSSSTSNSEPPAAAQAAWRRFARRFAATAAGGVALIWLFVVLVDPWDVLPLSLPLDRVPISSNQRFSYPALARSARFDSIVLGTSTSRLLRPAMLDGLFGARFANLAMNSATAHEQMRLLQVFASARRTAHTVILGLDQEWCGIGPLRRFTPRPFPEWMYEDHPWRRYREMLTLFAVQEAGNQALVLLGLKAERFGRDGYADFLPDDSRYDAARARAGLVWDGPPPRPLAASFDPESLVFAAHPLLEAGLAVLPAGTRVVLFFAPYHVSRQAPAGSFEAAVWATCKARLAALAARRPGTVVADFAIPSPITREDTHYWDPLHYRLPVAERVMRGLAAVAAGQDSPEGDWRLLGAAPAVAAIAP